MFELKDNKYCHTGMNILVVSTFTVIITSMTTNKSKNMHRTVKKFTRLFEIIKNKSDM